jgi:TonB family protein
MPDKHSHINHGVDPELIRKYLAGELDNKAMHALEKQALDDPFLADALDGFAERVTDQRVHLADLNKRLEVRTKGTLPKKGVRIFKIDARWMAAAGVALVVAVLFWMWQRTEENPAIAFNTTNVADSSITDTLQYYNQEEPKAWSYKANPDKVQGLIISADTLNTTYGRNNNAPVEGKPLAGIIEMKLDTVALAIAPTPAAIAAAAPTLAVDKEKADMQQDSINTKLVELAAVTRQREVEEDKARTASMYASAAKTAVPTRTIRGRVEDGENALAGVTVRLEGTSQGTVTDASGSFSLNVADTLSDVNLVTAYLGYSARKLKLRERQNDVNITLEPSNTRLSEVVLTGSDPVYRKKGYYRSPVPTGGYDSYKEYLSKNTHYPASAAAENVKGRVKVSFRVLPDGTLEDFKIAKRLQADCDAEALRVIKEGPGWMPASDRVATRMSVEVFFPAK